MLNKILIIFMVLFFVGCSQKQYDPIFDFTEEEKQEVITYQRSSDLAKAKRNMSLLNNDQREATPGKYFYNPSFKGDTYVKDQYVVGTYFFYWYTGVDDRFKNIPLYDNTNNYNYTNPIFYQTELDQIEEAGIDVIFPVYWGGNKVDSNKAWYNNGLNFLDDELKDRNLKVGMFFDTTTLMTFENNGQVIWEGADLRTKEGEDRFYKAIRNFYSRINPKHWARMDGEVIILLYSSYNVDVLPNQGFFDKIEKRFAKDFKGEKLFFIGDYDWQEPVDWYYNWGSAIHGPYLHSDVKCLGPGYDDRHLPGRSTLKERENTNYYQNGWEAIMAEPSSRFVMVETWNEMFEATEVAPTEIHKNSYTRLTRMYANQFKFKQAYSYALYRGILMRESETHPQYWIDWLNNYGTPVDLMYAFFSTGEFNNYTMTNEEYVEMLYPIYFDRNVDNDGRQFWTNLLDTGQWNRAQLRDHFLNDHTYRKSDNREFAHALYLDVLKREASEREVDLLVSRLNDGLTRVEALNETINGLEFKMNLDSFGDEVGKEIFFFDGWVD